MELYYIYWTISCDNNLGGSYSFHQLLSQFLEVFSVTLMKA